MNIRKSYLYIVLLILFLAVGCSTINKEKNSEQNNIPEIEEGQKHSNEESIEEIDPINKQIKEMTIDEKIGQMIIVGLDGYTIDEYSKKMIEDYYVSGFIMFSKNIEDSNQLLKLVNSLKDANLRNEVPLFMSIDEEGGRVSRMPSEFKKLPTNKLIGKLNKGELSYEIGSVIAEQIKSFGFNMDFAPVLDISSNPENSVIGNRSFGSNEKVVSELGVQTMKGIQSMSVVSVVKHFPGHGDTLVDSHIGLPSIDNDLNRLKNFELIPFKKAIDNGADAFMVAHILLSKIDSDHPSSLSRTIITDILREDLGFNGVVITDDMTMGAIIENYNIGEAAIDSVNAGSDIILVAHGFENGVATIDALKKAVESGVISEERLDSSVYRILNLKQKYEIEDKIIDSIDIDNINKKIKNILDKLQ